MAMAEEAAEMGAKYIVLPENFLRSDDPADQQVPGPLVEQVEAIAKKHNVYICVGMVESAMPYWRKDEWDKYLSAILVGPEGYISTHRKVDIVISPMAKAWKESHPKTDGHS